MSKIDKQGLISGALNFILFILEKLTKGKN